MRVRYLKNPLPKPTIRADRLGEALLPAPAVAAVKSGKLDPGSLPEIDLSIVTFESAADLCALFSSLLAQDYPLEKINLFLMRHAPDQEEEAVIGNFVHGHGTALRSVRVESRENRGFGAGHNANFRAGTARHFIVANADVEFYADTLTKLVHFALAAVGDCAAVEARQFPFNHPKFYHPASFETSWIVCCLALFDRSAFGAVGGFEELLFMYGEDVDLSLRLRARGYRLAFNPYSRVKHSVTRHRSRQLMVTGGFEATWLLRIADNPLQAVLLLAPRHLPLFLEYLRMKGPREGFTRMGAVARLALRRRASRWRHGLPAVSPPVNGNDFEWRRPFDADLDQMTEKQARGPLSELRVTVSILMRVTRGRGESFEFALRTAIAQTYPSVEVVVLEDGSSEMRERVRPYREAGFPVRYMSVAKVGRSQACNLLLAAARGTHCIFLDDDDFLFLEHAETLVEDGIGPDGSFGAAWAVSVLARRRDGRIEDGPYVLPKWYEKDFSHANMRLVNYFPIQSVIFSHCDALAVGRVNVALEYLEDWSFFGKLTAGRKGSVVRQVTSGFRLPRGWLSSRRRGRQHFALYEAARDDISAYLERDPKDRIPKQQTIRLLYHRVGGTECDPFALYVSPQRFEQHLNVIVNRIDKSIVARNGASAVGAPLRVEIHFDDAYSDIAPYVRACRARGLDVRVFATGYSFGDARYLPGDEYFAYLRQAFEATAMASRRAANGSAAAVPSPAAAPDEWYRFFCDLWKENPAEAEAILAAVRRASAAEPDVTPLLMSPGELQALSQDGCLVGSHGFAHERLAGRTRSFVADVAGRIGALVGGIDADGATHYAFPYGSDDDFDATAVEALGDAGYEHLYSCMGEDVDVGGTRILGRFQVGNLDALNFAECFDRCASALLVDGNLETVAAGHFLHDVVHVVDDTGW